MAMGSDNAEAGMRRPTVPLDSLPVSTRGTAYEDDAKELAYRLWAFRFGGQAHLLAAELRLHGFEVDAATVARWAGEDGWDRLARADLARSTVEAHERARVDFIRSVLDVVGSLRPVARGEGTATSAQLTAAAFLLDGAGAPDIRRRLTPGGGRTATARARRLLARAYVELARQAQGVGSSGSAVPADLRAEAAARLAQDDLATPDELASLPNERILDLVFARLRDQGLVD